MSLLRAWFYVTAKRSFNDSAVVECGAGKEAPFPVANNADLQSAYRRN